MYVSVGQIPEVSPFMDVLADKFVGVLDGLFLPGGVTVRKVYGCVQRPAILRRRRNSTSLSVVMERAFFLYGHSSLVTVSDTVSGFLPCGSLSKIRQFLRHLHRVRIALFWPFLSIRSISQYPNLFLSALAGRSWILTLSGMFVALVGRLRFLWRLYSSCGGSGSAVLRYCHLVSSHHMSARGTPVSLVASASRIPGAGTIPRKAADSPLPAGLTDWFPCCKLSVHVVHELLLR